MASWRPEFHDLESVLNYYEQFDSPYWNLYAGSRPEDAYLRWDFMVNDKAKGVEKLRDALESIKSNPNNNNTYLLQILMEEPPEPTDKQKPGRKPRILRKPLSKNVTFQLNTVDGLQPFNPMQQGIGYVKDNRQMEELISQNKKLIELIETRLTDVEEPEPVKQDQGFIGAILTNPTYQPLIEAVIMGIASKFLPENSQNQASKINGVPNDLELPPSLEDIFNELNSYGMTYSDFILLSKFARERTFAFKIYLQMLRKQF